MHIFSIKALSIIEEQVRRLHARIVETLRQPDLTSTPSPLRDEAAQLHAAAFDDLAHGDTLPFFRPHFLAISGSLVTLSRRMDELAAFIASLRPEERYKLRNLSEIFHALGTIMEMFMRAWAYLRTDMGKAAGELHGSLARISRFEDFSQKQDLGAAALLRPLTDALYMTDIAMKKLFVLLRP